MGRNGEVPLRGRFIVLFGPDGVGKTEVARELLRRLGGRYSHFRPPLRARDLQSSPSDDGRPKRREHGHFPLGPVRLLLSVVAFWLGYVGGIAPALRSGIDVVGDRWAYGYLVQPTALRFSGPDWLARWALRVLPRPDLVVNLNAGPETVRNRKAELALDEIRRELVAWAERPVHQLVTVDAEPPVAVVVDKLINELTP